MSQRTLNCWSHDDPKGMTYIWKDSGKIIHATIITVGGDDNVLISSLNDVLVKRHLDQGDQLDLLPSFCRTNIHAGENAVYASPIEVPDDSNGSFHCDSLEMVPNDQRIDTYRYYSWPKDFREYLTQLTGDTKKKFFLQGGNISNLTQARFIPVTDSNYTPMNSEYGSMHRDGSAVRASRQTQWGNIKSEWRFSTSPGNSAFDWDKIRPAEKDLKYVEEYIQIPPSTAVPTRSSGDPEVEEESGGSWTVVKGKKGKPI
ncbi:uncharacterized protein I206_100930 [Kwoniella pini CBS 10737]|uniref:Uncharacterized protein n=1 Tax=Kwoniella pini CBS 10737 TaxID=1296096 RepID=A0A1B9IBR9_9TREE|nr:uncharacterized protein I206_00396 [Kwoniella pini CBS 10737]OCF53095.1 hypothetical protein I206_00396 [Kwoniella pini CBS 10737]